MRVHHTEVPDELHVAEVGDGSRRVVFLHGLFGQGRNFHTIARSLCEADPSLRCLLVDLPDHGRSPWTQSFDYQAIADRVAAQDDLLTVDSPALLVGHSMGGKVAMQVALRHPTLVSHLVVVDISPAATDAIRRQFNPLVTALAGIDLTTLASRQEADRELAVAVTNPGSRAFLLQNLRHDHHAEHGRQWRWRMNLELIASHLDEIGDWRTDDGQVFDGPVTWVAGADSDYVRDEHVDPMRELFPRTRRVTVKNSGHWVHADQPEAFTAILQKALADQQ
ncbi:alpha/beta fold hydrolase [Aestuariimicrobium ganziense]|uniref:alpha/beta fold hydrolase n=1 Tax=Aestuariimicrobium ganziense TaxID=2773677 RepID=UPI002E2C810C|nr:alpha/beta fold hydrolase [Aestuariimicrobium ganziense]